MALHPVRGMDHIGITVADMASATDFLIRAFGAEIIYDSVTATDDDLQGEENDRLLNLAPGTRISAVRLLRLQHGPGIELFEMHGAQQRAPVRPSDYGLQHFAVYVADMSAATEKFVAAGGTLFTPPRALSFRTETGADNAFCYGRAPWGSVIELITYPTPMPYEQHTTLRRWRP